MGILLGSFESGWKTVCLTRSFTHCGEERSTCSRGFEGYHTVSPPHVQCILCIYPQNTDFSTFSSISLSLSLSLFKLPLPLSTLPCSLSLSLSLRLPCSSPSPVSLPLPPLSLSLSRSPSLSLALFLSLGGRVCISWGLPI